MLGEYVKLALSTLAAHRLRSSLTVLSIMIGVAAVILLTSLAESGLSTLSRSIEEVGGSKLILLWHESPRKAAQRAGDNPLGLTRGDVAALRERVSLLAHVAGYSENEETPMRRLGARPAGFDLIDVDEGFLPAYGYKLAAGRAFDLGDLEGRARVVVVGDGLAKELFGDQEAVGQELVLHDQRYRIIGRTLKLSRGGASFGWDWNRVAFVPLTLAHPEGAIQNMVLQSVDQRRNDELMNLANAILLARHHQVDDFRFLDFGGMLATYKMVFVGMIAVVGAIAGMSLVIGGVGIMNIMLVVLTERQAEIGLRKAVGATRREILTQFLVEAVVLSLFGALMGTAAGLALAGAASWLGPRIYPDWVGLVDFPAVVVAVLAAASTGLFFGWYPARLAASADPIVSLRAE